MLLFCITLLNLLVLTLCALLTLLVLFRNGKVNSVLSAYGIPTIAEKNDFTSVYVQVPDAGDQRTVCAFSYPNFWVEARFAALLLPVF